MMQLLSNYSVTQIITFVVLLALAIKGVISFFDWAKEKARKPFEKEQSQKKLEDKIEETNKALQKLVERQDNMNKNIQLLLQSDMEDIKAYITREHHYFCYQKGWIDDYSLDCCEKRFLSYQSEGGNSYIESLMKEIRKLPKRPPQYSVNHDSVKDNEFNENYIRIEQEREKEI